MPQLENCWIFITTYSMVGLKRERENKMLEKTQSMAWGICVADEVHKLSRNAEFPAPLES